MVDNNKPSNDLNHILKPSEQIIPSPRNKNASQMKLNLQIMPRLEISRTSLGGRRYYKNQSKRAKNYYENIDSINNNQN